MHSMRTASSARSGSVHCPGRDVQVQNVVTVLRPVLWKKPFSTGPHSERAIRITASKRMDLAGIGTPLPTFPPALSALSPSAQLVPGIPLRQTQSLTIHEGVSRKGRLPERHEISTTRSTQLLVQPPRPPKELGTCVAAHLSAAIYALSSGRPGRLIGLFGRRHDMPE